MSIKEVNVQTGKEIIRAYTAEEQSAIVQERADNIVTEQNLPYDVKRRKAYPPIPDQLDALWKGGQAQADMKAIIDGVKAAYPKP